MEPTELGHATASEISSELEEQPFLLIHTLSQTEKNFIKSSWSLRQTASFATLTIATLLGLSALVLSLASVTAVPTHDDKSEQLEVKPAKEHQVIQYAEAVPLHPTLRNPDEYILCPSWDVLATPKTRSYNWTISAGNLNPDGIYRPMMLINNQFPGPLVECNEGDNLVVHIDNQGPNATSIHFHGLFQNGTNFMDGTVGVTQCAIAPNSSMTLRFAVRGQFGTYWYHAHHSAQASDGLLGPMIIHSVKESKLQELDYDSDRVVMVQDHYHNLTSELLMEYLSPGQENEEPVPDNALINGRGVRDCADFEGWPCDVQNVTIPTIDLTSGNRHRLRIINVGAFAEFAIQFDQHPFYVIEVDGTIVHPVPFNRLNILPAQRYSVVVEANVTTASSFWMRARMVTHCFNKENHRLKPEIRAIVRYTSPGTQLPLPEPKSKDWPEVVDVLCHDLNTSVLHPVEPITPPPVDDFVYLRANFEIGAWRLSRGYFNDSTFHGNATQPSLHRFLDSDNAEQIQTTPLGVNDIIFDRKKELVLETTGIRTVDISISNFDDGAHPFHLHGHHVFVLAQGHSGYPPTEDELPSYLAASGALDNPLRRDTVTVEGPLASFARGCAATINSSHRDTGSFTFTLKPKNGTKPMEYYVPSPTHVAPVAVFQSAGWTYENYDSFPLPFTVFNLNATTISGSLLDELYTTSLADDVYIGNFLEGLYLTAPSSSCLDASAISWIVQKSITTLVIPSGLSMEGTRDVYPFKTISVPPVEIAPGPYILTAGQSSATFNLLKVYSLFADLQEAFMSTFTVNDDGSFSYANIWNAAQYGLLVPVPSKLYYSTMDEARYPLAGLRFAVKDLMPVAGVLTSGGSREMLRLRDSPDAITAPAVQRLIDLGAVLIGKTKLTVFAFGAWPYQTDDFPYSWNPRADGYLGLSASSYGSAAAISAYDALDFTIGSDTLGSVRNPADRAGVYGLRPTWGVMNLTQVIPSASSLDTLGLFARSPQLLTKVAKEWDTDFNPALIKANFSLPNKIIFPAINNSIAQDLIDNWLSNLTVALNMTLEYQNVTELFTTNVDANDTLSNYTSTISSLTSYDNYHLFGKDFLADYYTKFERYPELDIAAFQSWQVAQNLTTASKTASEQRRQEFEEFINKHVIPFDSDTCTEGIWVYHISDTGGGVPEYRDILTYDYFPLFKPMRGASIAPFAKLVDVTIPIGSISYDSIISKVNLS
ncbi:hypothetical protein G7046_g8406 [Stylonectria norvegica]|nr:hypothetical protein G7046_g8406 [Stylonectria norvegica]